MSEPSCSAPDCERRVKARGWCSKHYQRWKAHGDPLHTERPTLGVPPVDRLTHFIDAEGDCWIWTGTISPNGYGSIRVDGTNTTAHRAVWEVLVGSVPEGFHVDHLCRNPPCVNPDHLEPVTPGENHRRGARHKGVYQPPDACPQGHPYEDENLYVHRGIRYCKTCRRERQRRTA